MLATALRKDEMAIPLLSMVDVGKAMSNASCGRFIKVLDNSSGKRRHWQAVGVGVMCVYICTCARVHEQTQSSV